MILTERIKLDETPSQLDKLQDTLTVIAEIRDSERLRSFLYNPEYAIYPPATPQPQQPVTSPLNFDVRGSVTGPQHSWPCIRSLTPTNSLSVFSPISHIPP
jgi:hypothetical protein